MLIDIALLFLAFFLTIPAVIGYFAYSYGKSFWIWFMLGCFLPIISHILLALLCSRKPSSKKKSIYTEMTRYEDEYMQDHIKASLQSSFGKEHFSDSKSET